MQTVILLSILLSLRVRALCSPNQNIANIEPLAGSHHFQALLSQPIPTHAGADIQCYEKYFPRITAAIEMSKATTEMCSAHAESRRHDELSKVREQREHLDNRVIYMTNTLSYCGKLSDLEYLKCLKDYHVNLLVTSKDVSELSSQLSEYLTCIYKNIDCSEDICIRNVLAKSKKDTHDVLVALENCLLNRSHQQRNLKEWDQWLQKFL